MRAAWVFRSVLAGCPVGFAHTRKSTWRFYAIRGHRRRGRGKIARLCCSHLQRGHCAGSSLVEERRAVCAVCVGGVGTRRVVGRSRGGTEAELVNSPTPPSHRGQIRSFFPTFKNCSQTPSLLAPSAWIACQSLPWPRGRRCLARRWPSDYEGENVRVQDIASVTANCFGGAAAVHSGGTALPIRLGHLSGKEEDSEVVQCCIARFP